ncbi:RNA polymerase sigma70 (plasmid) [Citrobacter amalonaticus Y19]|uniref:RNA polymerase sigma70 n=1 Tax=Citrobacter amalonaticus Y19 TaxID=1261127 RepID=A0A0F6U0N5_CITAM|nr:sigma-70 family RNA polymerase sigma factor [Citrobacter amalonaticus]AKE62254.1 RNA polymerase sigma70 [Citrobacter amalonaticus Y19]
MSNQRQTPPCILSAWHTHEGELQHWLLRQLGQPDRAADALHDIFLKALSQDLAFCNIENPRAWLFQVARNYLVDSYRKSRTHIDLADMPETELVHEGKTDAPLVDDLTQCLPRILPELSTDDSHILRCCDIDGMPLQQYADENKLTLPATKSRIQRARKRLREQMILKCQVKIDDTGRVRCFVPRKNNQ